MPAELMKNPRFLINPTGRFCHRWPDGRLRPDRPQDHRRHLRGATARRRCLPGDPSKVDCSAAYAGRYVAKTSCRRHRQTVSGAGIVRNRRIASGIGTVDTEGTSKLSNQQIVELINKHFRPAPERHHPDARPAAGNLLQNRFTATSAAKSRNSAGNAPTRPKPCRRRAVNRFVVHFPDGATAPVCFSGRRSSKCYTFTFCNIGPESHVRSFHALRKANFSNFQRSPSRQYWPPTRRSN